MRRPCSQRIVIGVSVACIAAALASSSILAAVPVIDITDLYHGHEDDDDNYDLPMAYGLPEIDLKAVILDATKTYLCANPARSPGQIPVEQMNLAFGRNVPYAYSPFTAMTSVTDTLSNAPASQQKGINLLLNTLRQSNEPVHIVSFGSARVIAAAYNREPELMRKKVAKIYLLASSQPSDDPNGQWCPEWDVKLDPYAFERVVTSDLPLAMCPGQAKNNPGELGRYNTYWNLPSMSFIKNMAPSLQSYCAFVYNKSMTSAFLPAMNQPVTNFDFANPGQHVWNTAIWLAVSGRKLVQHANGQYAIIPGNEVKSDDTVLPSDLLPAKLQYTGNGQYSFTATNEPTNQWQYDRGDNPRLNQTALREAVPKLFTSFTPNALNLKRISQVPVANASFESVSLGKGQLASVAKMGAAAMPNWKPMSIGVGQDAGTLCPDATMYGAVPDGSNVLYVLANSTSGSTSDAAVSQVLSSQLQPNTHYVLSVLVGQRLDLNSAGYKVQLLAGDRLLAEDNNDFPLTPGCFIPTLLTYDTGDSVLYPGNLEIRLFALNGASIGNQVSFASIDLEAIHMPEPGSAVLFGTAGVLVSGYGLGKKWHCVRGNEKGVEAKR